MYICKQRRLQLCIIVVACFLYKLSQDINNLNAHLEVSDSSPALACSVNGFRNHYLKITKLVDVHIDSKLWSLCTTIPFERKT